MRRVVETLGHAATLLVKDLGELLSNARAIFLALILPCVFLYLVGQLRTQSIEARVLLAGAGKPGTNERAAADAVAAALAELSGIEVAVDEGVPDNLGARLKEGRFDVLVLSGGATSLLYTAGVDPFRIGVLQQVVPRIEAVVDAARTDAAAPRVPLPVPAALNGARSSLREASNLARVWQNAPEPPIAAAAIPAAASTPAGSPPQIVVQPPSRNESLVQAITKAESDLDRALLVRPDALAWRTARARAAALEDRLGRLKPASPTLLNASEKEELGAVAAEAEAIAASIQYDGPADAPPEISRSRLLTLATPAPSGTLVSLYPVAGDRPRALLPEIAALIICVLPFVLSCNAFVREREERTLDVLLAVPRMAYSSIVAGKSAAAVIATVAVCLSLLMVMHVAYGLFIKSGLLAMIVLGVVPAATAAALLGLAVSAWTNSSLQATIASAIYLLVQALVGGLLYPVAAGTSDVISVLAMAFPLTFVSPAIKAWAFGASPEWAQIAVPLIAMCTCYAVLARVALGSLVKRL